MSALCLAGALAPFLVYPVSAQSENEPLTASFLTDTGPSNHGGAGQTFTIRIRFSTDSRDPGEATLKTPTTSTGDRDVPWAFATNEKTVRRLLGRYLTPLAKCENVA